MVDYDVYHRLCVTLYLKMSEDSINILTLQLQPHLFCSKLNFRMLMILIEMKLLTFMILSHKCSIVVVKVLNTLIHQSFIL